MSKDQLIIVQPGTDRVVFRTECSTVEEVDAAVRSAREAFPAWANRSADDRIAIAQRFATIAEQNQSNLAKQISDETGKPRWESLSEAKLVPAKVKLSVSAFVERTSNSSIELPQGVGQVRYVPQGVMAVLGPFNFPAHLPNGHLVPALLAGNTVVFKPSEMTPGVGSMLVDYWKDAGLPDGVLQTVQGGGDIGKRLIDSPIDGVLFTGSYATGCAIHRQLSGRPEVVLALEMGGNNPLVVWEIDDIEAAAYATVVSAFITAGQRCTCARRLIVSTTPLVDSFLSRVISLARQLRTGMPDDEPQPFMGSLISTSAVDQVVEFQRALVASGSTSLLNGERSRRNSAIVSPAIIDTTGVSVDDKEVFGPLLQIRRVKTFDEAIDEANRTKYGLAASLLSDREEYFALFRRKIRAGVINWNQPTTGASGRLPFGGLGASGNHRPSGYHAAEYCDDATALLTTEKLRMPAETLPGIFNNLSDAQS